MVVNEGRNVSRGIGLALKQFVRHIDENQHREFGEIAGKRLSLPLRFVGRK
jgi:hypothetical protein